MNTVSKIINGLRRVIINILVLLASTYSTKYFKECKHGMFFEEFRVDSFSIVVVCDAVYLAVFYHVTGLMKIQVKVEEVLMLLELFMEVEAILMRMRLVFISVV